MKLQGLFGGQVVKEHGPAIDGNAVKAMAYADAVVKEVMRLHPIVGGVFRRALRDFDLGGFHISKVLAFAIPKCRLSYHSPVRLASSVCIKIAALLTVQVGHRLLPSSVR